MPNEKDVAVNQAIKEVEKQFGKGALIKLGERLNIKVDTVPTGSIMLDYATGIGGLPRGRIIEIFGPESQGKTTMALHAIAETQKKGGKAAFIDVEHSLDPRYAESIGVDVDELYVSQPDTAEMALDIIQTLVLSKGFTTIVLDSIAALVPKAELEGSIEKMQVALQARLMSKHLRKITGAASKSNTCLIFINQIREKVGIMWGNPEDTPGGKALKFYSSIRIDVRKRKQIKGTLDGMDIVTAILCQVKVVKNKLAPPFRFAQVQIDFGTGINREKDLIIAGIKAKFIKKNGAIYTIPKMNVKVKGENALIKYLKDNKSKSDVLRRNVIKKLA